MAHKATEASTKIAYAPENPFTKINITSTKHIVFEQNITSQSLTPASAGIHHRDPQQILKGLHHTHRQLVGRNEILY
jgi:hypothetical protein